MRLDHVQVAIPVGGEPLARNFYGTVLGLVEIEKPAALVGRGGCWFRLGDQALHCGVEVEFNPARKAHVALAVGDLDPLKARLARSGRPVKEEQPLCGRARFFSSDPFDNRIEFIAERPS